jgi:cation/acetate symporter
VAAGAMAAALSTAAGLLLVISTSVSRDLFRTFKPNMSEKKELRIARLAAAGAVVIAGYFGINPPGFVAEVVAFAFGLAAASFFPVIIMGIFSSRINKEGAIAGMLSGLVFTISYIIFFKFISPELNTAENWWFGISPEGIGSIGMFLNFFICIIVSKFTPAPPQAVQDMIQEIRIPRGAGDAQAH